MQKHVKVYIEFFDYCEQDVIMCECGCNKVAVDIHHLDSKGMGGTSFDKDYIENLMALARECHNKAHGSKQHNTLLKELHLNYLENYINFSRP